MRKLSLPQLKAYIANVVTEAKISNDSFSVTRDNIVGLVDKIGKLVTIDTYFANDKLSELEGEFLGLGKTIEEWQEDLYMVEDYSASGSGALSPASSSYRPAFYSYTLGRKVIKVTIPNNDIERACLSEADFVSISAMKLKRLQDSMAVYRYGVKREMLGKFAGMAVTANTDSSATAFGSISTSTPVGTHVKYSTTNYGILVKAWPSSNPPANWAAAVAAGYIIEYDLVETLAVPVDTSTSEAFIKAVKESVEIASDISEGHSLNGNTLGAVEGLKLYVKQGVMPVVQVDALAGAFQKEELAIPAELEVIKDFGNADSSIYAILVDKRGCKLHNTYNATRENFNGDGDFLNLFRHTEDTAFISRNVFIRVFKAS